MSKKYDFQYIVIGSGPSGTAAATTLAKAKKRIAIVEGRFYGGVCLNSVDVPYSVALGFAHTYANISTAPEFKQQDYTYNLPTVIASQRRAALAAGANNKKSYEDLGVVCLDGYANILDAHTIAIGDKKYTTNYLILATGARLKTSEIHGIDTMQCLTPETAIRVRRMPEVVAVVGAGSTGCEIASYYAELGANVILLETADRILPKEDSEASLTITDYFKRKLGIRVLTGCKVTAVARDEISKYVVFCYGTAEKMVRVEQIILATGSQPALDYGLENAGVKYKNSGISVNKLFETSAKNIYAIGDCIGSGESSTERAYQQGITLATNIVNKTKTSPSYQGIIRLTNTFPQVAAVGYNETDLMKRDRKFKKSLIGLNDITASKISGLQYGFVKLLADSKKNEIIGGTVVAPNANLIIQEIALAIRHHHTAIELASTPHPINDYSYAVKLAAKQLLRKKH